MKKFIYLFQLYLLLVCSSAFSQTATELQATARSFMQQADYNNAVLVLNRAGQMEPQNIEIKKDLSLAYYMQRDNAKALEVIKPLLERDDADDQCFQIAANIYKQLEQPKESDKLYRRAIKKFPASGPLYNDLGELLWEQNDYTAIKQWERGIETDPSYSKNYYNASKYYFFTTDKIWSIIYGEIFINMEPFSSRTPEIKTILLESYKKLFASSETALAVGTEKNQFVAAYIKTIWKQNAVATAGINTETLTMIRARFILDWYQEYADKLPFKLFEFHRQLLREGMFDAYNHWIFEPVQNLPAYQNWIVLHATEYNEFTRFQKGRIFKIPAGQYYHTN